MAEMAVTTDTVAQRPSPTESPRREEDEGTLTTLAERPVEGPRRAPAYALVAGSTISLVGNQLTALAVPWFVLQTTGSAGRTGLVAFASLLPTVLGLVFGGALADRVGYRRISVLADLASAGTVAAIPLLYHTVGLPFGLLLALVFFGSLFDAPGGTARNALIPDTAALARLPLERVNGVFQGVQTLAGVIGPLLAGALIGIVGVSDVLWLDAASFLVSAAAVAVFVPQLRPASQRADVPRARFLEDVGEGWRFLFGDPLLRSIATLAIAINFLASPLFAVLLPVMALREYGSAGDLGLALAGVAGGGVVGALLYGVFGARMPRRRVLIGGFAFASLPLIVLAWAPPLWVTAVALAACGLGLGPLNPLVMTVLQERVPTELRARVIGAVTATAMVAAPAGVLIAGGLAEWFDVQVLIGAVAVGLFLMTIPILLSRPLRDLDGAAGSPAASARPRAA